MSKRGTRTTRVQEQDYWKLLKETFGEFPKEVNAQLVESTMYYKNNLINILKGHFIVEAPTFWDIDYILDLLILGGRFYVCDSPLGILPFNGTSSGVNVFNRPTDVTITNQVLETFDRILGKDCVVVYLFDNKFYRSFVPALDLYAQRLANIDASMDINLINTRLPWIFNAQNDKQAKEAKYIYDKVTRGEPAIFTKVNTSLTNDDDGLLVTSLPVKENYVTDKLLEAKRSVLNEFLTIVGINTTPFEKKERLVVDEVNSNNEEKNYNIRYINNNLKNCCDKVFEMFGIRLKIRMEGDTDEKTENW